MKLSNDLIENAILKIDLNAHIDVFLELLKNNEDWMMEDD